MSIFRTLMQKFVGPTETVIEESHLYNINKTMQDRVNYVTQQFHQGQTLVRCDFGCIIGNKRSS